MEKGSVGEILFMLVFGLGFFAATIAALYYYDRWRKRRGVVTGASTSAAAERDWSVVVPMGEAEALASATTRMLREGFSLDSRTQTTATFSKYQEANVAAGCFLMLLFLLPGILYLLLAGGDRHVTLMIVPGAEEKGDGVAGSRVVVGGDSGDGKVALRRWAEELARPKSGP